MIGLQNSFFSLNIKHDEITNEIYFAKHLSPNMEIYFPKVHPSVPANKQIFKSQNHEQCMKAELPVIVERFSMEYKVTVLCFNFIG